MTILQSGIAKPSSGYDIDQSLRIDDGDSAYLSRTPGSAGNRKTWTWSGWVKRGNIGTDQQIFSSAGSSHASGADISYISFRDVDDLAFYHVPSGGSAVLNLITTQLFRDPSAWYHLVFVLDTTQAVEANRAKIFVNGEQITSFSTATYPSQDYALAYWNSTRPQVIGDEGERFRYPYDGYLAEVYLVDGTALTQASFGETDAATNQWKPIEATGLTYGTNGFYQKYSATELAASFEDSAERSVYTVTANGNAHTDTTVKKIGTASLQLDGTGDYLSFPDNSFVWGTGDFTMEAWIKFGTPVPSSGHTVFFNGGTGDSVAGAHWALFYYQSGGTKNWGWSDDGTASTEFTYNWDYTADTDWHHIAMCRQSGTYRFYIDGTQRVGTTTGGSQNLSGTTNFLLGSGYGDFSGYMDEVRYSDTCLYLDGTTFTPYTTARTADSNTVLLLHCDGSDSGTTFTDSSWSGTPRHTITANGDVTNTRAIGNFNVQSLIVGGGGGGNNTFTGGGGAAGGFREITTSIDSSKAWAITVGSGGSTSSKGNDSSAFGYISTGGGAGDGDNSIDSTNDGGSGGGGSGGPEDGGGTNHNGGSGNTPSTSPSQGNNGGYGRGHGSGRGAGGGGGSGGAGGNGSSGASSTGGAGGTGTQNAWQTDSNQYYAAGGGGGAAGDTSGTGGTGGSSIGGNGSGQAVNATSPTANTGSGGGGRGNGSGSPTAGSDGIVVIRYQSASALATGGTITTYGSGASQYYVHTFTADGTFTPSASAKDRPGTSSIKFDGTGDYLSIPPSSDFSFETGAYTVEAWIRLSSSASSVDFIWDTRSGQSNGFYFLVRATGMLEAGDASGTIQTGDVLSDDTWTHVALVRTGTGTNAAQIYVAGASEVTGTLSTTISGTDGDNIFIGSGQTEPEHEFYGWMDEIRVSDSARYTGAYTPSTTAFTADANTKLLIHSDFNGGLGADSSGNKNDFTPTNLVATDQMIDTPTLNYCTLNPLSKVGTTVYGEGNLYGSGVSDAEVRGTFQIPNEGKWYWEFYQGMPSSGLGYYDYTIIGISDPTNTVTSYLAGKGCLYYGNTGGIYNPSPLASYGAAFTLHDIIGMAVDMDSNQMTFYKNNSSQGTVTISETPADKWVPAMTNAFQAGGVFNFGQDSSFAGNKTAQGNGGTGEDFYYTPPAGFISLCSENLPSPEIALPTDHFNTVLWAGNDAAPRTITGVGFNPDLSWVKGRDTSSTGNTDHHVSDSIRGANNNLVTNSTGAEYNPATATSHGGIGAVTTDGFTLISGTADPNSVNESSKNYVAWNWKAGGAPTTDNLVAAGGTPTAGSVKINGSNLGSALAGTIAATRLSANTTNGFSVVSYTGTGSAATIGHGLSSAPDMVIVKNRDDGAESWVVSVGNATGTASEYLVLNSTIASQTDTSQFPSAPGSSVVSLGATANVNVSTEDFIAYCFHSVEGYSKVGTFVGNGVVDGTFIYTGFRPSFLLCKRLTGDDWMMLDDARSPINAIEKSLAANDPKAEIDASGKAVDFVSNGIKMRNADNGLNLSGITFLYIAFAESPFKTSNAR